jgi:hypothetical protein
MTDHSSTNQSSQKASPIYLSFPRKVILTLCGGAIVGALLSLAGAGLYSGGTRRLLLAYLVAFAFVLSLSLGSLFFVLLQHMTRAGWGVLVRRPAEIFSLNVITVAVLFLPIAWSVAGGSGELYPWARQDAVPSQPQVDIQPHAGNQPHVSAVVVPVQDHTESADDHAATDAEAHNAHPSLYAHQTVDELTRSKQDWLNPTAYLLRAGLFFAVWILISGFYFRCSRHQDSAGGNTDTRRMEWWAGPAAFASGLTLTYAAFDFLMSLDPHWYSTIFGVYYFAGCAVGGFSVILLSVLLLERLGVIPALISDEHRRDLGRLLFAFVFFWGYIAFSQYMLLWYANVPETTRWFVVRGASLAEGFGNSWGYLLVFLLFGHFIIPFLGIMSRHVKSNQRAMIFWTLWMLVMHYFDLYWLVMPELGPHFTFGLPELGTLLFVTCVYLLGASLIATRTSLIPIGDPRLIASRAITDAY